jgi:hypothetical protein
MCCMTNIIFIPLRIPTSMDMDKYLTKDSMRMMSRTRDNKQPCLKPLDALEKFEGL